MFSVPTLGPPKLLCYFRVAHGKGQSFSNALLCGYSGCHGFGNYPVSFRVKDNCREFVDCSCMFLETKENSDANYHSKHLYRIVSLL
jgi:hypothetical protein